MAPCSKCHQPHTRNGRYCRTCHNTYMRQWRTNRGGHQALTPEERHKDNARSYLNTYVSRGAITKPATCTTCQNTGPIEAHHHNGYDKPLDIQWLCRTCHKTAHNNPKPT